MGDTVKKSWADELKTEGVMHHGFGLLPKYAMCDPDLPLTAKAIYAYLCSLSGNGETAFPGRDTILSRLGIGKKCYYNHMNALKEQGYISVERAPSVHGQFAHNIYYIKSNPKKFSEQYLSSGNGKSIIYFQGIKRAGFGAIPRMVMMDERLNVLAKGIYAYFACFAAVGEAACPEVKTILYHLNINETTYRKYLKSLVETNYLIIKQRYENFRLGVNDYILVDNPDESSVEEKTRTPKPTYVINSKTKPSGQTKENNGKKESLATQGTSDQSVTKEDMVREDVAEEAVVTEAMAKENVAKQPVVQEPVARQTMAKADATIIRSSSINHNKTSSSENQSIYPSTPQSTIEDVIDRLNENELKEAILKKIGLYDELYGGNPPSQQALEIQKLVALVVNTITIKEKTIHIARAHRARQDVVETLFGLTKKHYIYVLESLQKVTQPIKNPVQYQLTALYNAPTTYKETIPPDNAWVRRYVERMKRDLKKFSEDEQK